MGRGISVAEKKAKVGAAVWGTEFIKLLASVAFLH